MSCELPPRREAAGKATQPIEKPRRDRQARNCGTDRPIDGGAGGELFRLHKASNCSCRARVAD